MSDGEGDVQQVSADKDISTPNLFNHDYHSQAQWMNVNTKIEWH